MSDPIAVSILAKLTSWFPFDGNLFDAHGGNDLNIGTSVSGYSAGKVGSMLDENSRAATQLLTPIPISVSSARLTIGGWLYYNGSIPSRADFGFSAHFDQHNEVFTLESTLQTIKVTGFRTNTDGDAWKVGGLGGTPLSYPVRFAVDDSIGQTATSDQIITVIDAANPLQEGWYFVVATWDEGDVAIYVDTVLTESAWPPASIAWSEIDYFQVGNQYLGANSVAGLDEIFFCDGACLTQDEIDWLYNVGSGRSYAAVVAAAA